MGSADGIVRELRRLADKTTGARVVQRERRQLTITPDTADVSSFTFTAWEARARGWTPIAAGRISGDDDLVVTFCSAPGGVSPTDLIWSILAPAAETGDSPSAAIPQMDLAAAAPIQACAS